MLARLGRRKTRFFIGSPRTTQRPPTRTLDRQAKMYLANCAACGAPNPNPAWAASPILYSDGWRCEGCQTRYCSLNCIDDHWFRGHAQICEEIHRAGGAEQYHANQKYNEAIAVAVEACAVGSAHPVTAAIEVELRNARAKLYPRRDMLYRTLPAAYYRDALAALKKTPSRGA